MKKIFEVEESESRTGPLPRQRYISQVWFTKDNAGNVVMYISDGQAIYREEVKEKNIVDISR